MQSYFEKLYDDVFHAVQGLNSSHALAKLVIAMKTEKFN